MSLKKKFIKSKEACKVTFHLPIEAVGTAREVKVLGDFNNWNVTSAVEMQVNKKGCTASLELPIGREYQFRYLIDGNLWENDWQADRYVVTPFGVENSVVMTYPE